MKRPLGATLCRYNLAGPLVYAALEAEMVAKSLQATGATTITITMTQYCVYLNCDWLSDGHALTVCHPKTPRMLRRTRAS